MFLTLEEINVIYGKKEGRVHALKDLCLGIEEGEFVTIMGKSGCGKSTLLNVLGAIRKPTKGIYKFKGKDIGEMRDAGLAKFRNKNLGFVLQNFALLNDRSVYDNVSLPLKYMKTGAKEQRKRVGAILKEMDLLNKISKYPSELSGGQKQRVALARALVTKPKLLLADEPTGSLDEETGIQIMELLREINEEGTTIVMVTHDKEFANYGNHLITMKDGRIIKEE
ncbi:putative ABC transport system ATP-binding protein [Acetitomaculum ruminis DSM 5522]|uniref:Putative ABC transport system ATP-binding protein n=1 Tax=Acetitomaculum ruminis DSM 5522 TaxID=1120918 RepID=A0A1I0W374_9FIRM|nr:ABC transporter ATP-binding protein [Acetitomaculum ruminis]SFA83061.1 putative ABC transport system ATP-binding protein [Acetitomaculum ruminis DSM 5522]